MTFISNKSGKRIPQQGWVDPPKDAIHTSHNFIPQPPSSLSVWTMLLSSSKNNSNNIKNNKNQNHQDLRSCCVLLQVGDNSMQGRTALVPHSIKSMVQADGYR